MAAVNFKEAMLLDEAIAQIAGLFAASNMLAIEVDTRIFLVEDYELELHELSVAWPNIKHVLEPVTILWRKLASGPLTQLNNCPICQFRDSNFRGGDGFDC